MTALEQLMRRWQAGWSKSRGWNDYATEDGITTVQVGGETRMVDYVLTDEDPVRAERAARLAQSDEHPAGLSWLTIVSIAPDKLIPRLDAAGLEVVRPEYLMTVPLTQQPAHTAEAPYEMELATQPGRVDVRVKAGEEEAASGRVVVIGADAIPDVIQTDAAHRRRGLGRAVMSALVKEAQRQGATEGLLVASSDGLSLYRSIGWSVAAEIVIARSKGCAPGD